MLSITCKPHLLGVITLNVVMLSVVTLCITCLVVNISFASGCHKKYWHMCHLVTQPAVVFLNI
jgi:hypothetical protein